MKLFMLFSGIIAISLLSSCGKTDFPDSQNAQVIKDCTSSYLRIDNKDYLICNESFVQNHSNNSQVQVTFKEQTGCSYTGTCYMNHEYEYSVEILSIQ